MRRSLPALLGLGLALLAAGLACDRPTPVAPEGSTLTITANPSRIAVNGESALLILGRRMDGKPVNQGTEVTLSTTLGTVDPGTVNTDASGIAHAMLRGNGVEVGTATVTAFSGAAGEAMVEVKVGSLGTSIIVTPTPSQLPKSGGTVDLLAVVFDDIGTPLANAAVTFGSQVGNLDSGGASVITNARGEARDVLRVSANDLTAVNEGFFEVSAATTTEGGTQIEDVSEVDVGGSPASLFFQATPTSVSELEGGEVSLLAGVRDGAGEPLEGANVNFLTEVGSLDSGGAVLQTDAGGTARDTLRVSPADIAGFPGTSFTVRAQVAGFGGEVLEQSESIRIQTGFPQASFTVEVSGLTASFTNTSTGEQPLSCLWTFAGDASISTSNQCSPPDVTYQTNGQKTVTLKVSNSLGESEVTSTFSIP